MFPPNLFLEPEAEIEMDVGKVQTQYLNFGSSLYREVSYKPQDHLFQSFPFPIYIYNHFLHFHLGFSKQQGKKNICIYISHVVVLLKIPSDE